MVHIIRNCLKRLIVDLDKEVLLNPVHQQLFVVALTLLRECDTALDDYFINVDEDKLNRYLILAAMDFVQQWESWTEKLEYPDLKSSSSKIFHEMLLRFCKGILKSWRIWRIDRRK